MTCCELRTSRRPPSEAGTTTTARSSFRLRYPSNVWPASHDSMMLRDMANMLADAGGLHGGRAAQGIPVTRDDF